jgi:hypothetical protein
LDEIGLVVYEEMSFKVKVYGRQTTPDGRRTKSDHKSSPCHFVTGELKMDNLCCAGALKIEKYPSLLRSFC